MYKKINTLVSACFNCSADAEEGTFRQKGALWIKIKESYDAAIAKRLNVMMHKRTMKAIKRHLISQGGATERMRASGEAINNIEGKAHELHWKKRVVVKLSFFTS